MTDYYKVLGVSPDADADAIKSRYRKLAKENHPDLHPGDAAAEARFKEIGEAWEVLGDVDKRKKYDESQLVPKPGKKTKKTAPVGQVDMSDIMNQFDSFFGKSAPSAKPGQSSQKQANPFDATGLFEKYMGIKKK